jgi:DNA-binding HxlR family transcriptional regulator
MPQEVTKRLLAQKQKTLHDHKNCAAIATLKTFATKWKPCIICYLAQRPFRYNELYRIIPTISRKMLSMHLRELENDQLIIRNQYDYKKQRVEYLLSEKGKSLLAILEQLQYWGLANLSNVLSIQQMIASTLPKNPTLL